MKLVDKSWKLEDAQKIANEFPYTFYKPSHDVVSLLKKGNLAKMIFTFETTDPEAPRAERMWVEIEEVVGNEFKGYLDNDPVHIKDIKYKDLICFNSCHIIDTDLKDPVPSIVDKYYKRCFVTTAILYEGARIGYLYREAPDNEEDSGWRILSGDEAEEYMDNIDNIHIVSLGAVLSVDDSFISLLDSDECSEYVFDQELGEFVEVRVILPS